MKIESINCTPFSIPLKAQRVFASGTMNAADHVLIEIHTDDGLTGTAEAMPRSMIYGESQRGIVAAIEEYLAPKLIGKSPFELERIHQQFNQVQHNNTAKAALDMALFDLIGQATATSCLDLMGGYANEIRLTFMCTMGEPQAVTDSALAMQAQHGFTSFKIKTGLNFERDQAVLRSLRKALPDATLYMDGNQGHTLDEALRLMTLAEELGIAYFEEPCATQDRVARRVLAARGNPPVLGDESCRTLLEAAREISDATVRMVSIKTARTGFYQSRKIIALCEASGIGILCGTQGDTGIGMTALWHFAAAHAATQKRPVETFLLDLVDDLLQEPLVIRHGCLKIARKPGLGINIDREKLQRYRVD